MKDKNVIERKVVSGRLFEVRFNEKGEGCKSCCFGNGLGNGNGKACIRDERIWENVKGKSIEFERCTCVNRKDGRNVYFTEVSQSSKQQSRHWGLNLSYLDNGNVLTIAGMNAQQKRNPDKMSAVLTLFDSVSEVILQKMVDLVSVGCTDILVDIKGIRSQAPKDTLSATKDNEVEQAPQKKIKRPQMAKNNPKTRKEKNNAEDVNAKPAGKAGENR